MTEVPPHKYMYIHLSLGVYEGWAHNIFGESSWSHQSHACTQTGQITVLRKLWFILFLLFVLEVCWLDEIATYPDDSSRSFGVFCGAACLLPRPHLQLRQPPLPSPLVKHTLTTKLGPTDTSWHFCNSLALNSLLAEPVSRSWVLNPHSRSTIWGNISKGNKRNV